MTSKVKQVQTLWDENAERWSKASEKGVDVWRDCLNTPAFLKMLPDVSESIGLDIGCGEGYNSLLIAKRCKKLIAVDISESMLKCNKAALAEQKNLYFQICDATTLPFPDNAFDFAVSTMSFMDMPDIEKVLKQIFRVLKKGGFLQFSILHPCFNEYKGKWIENENGIREGLIMRDYFDETEGEIHEWKHYYSSAEEKPFRVARFFKPLSKWLNSVIQAGFSFEEFIEPYADDKDIQKYPALFSSRIVAHSLIIRAMK